MPPALRTVFQMATDPGAASPSQSLGAPAWRRMLHGAQALLMLGARWVVAQAFFLSGLTKLRDWDVTLALFQDEYAVPLLPPNVAAVLGTGGELLLPALMLMGLGGRFAAAGLFVLNVVAVISLADIAPAALVQHQLWGALLLGVWFWGPGPLSVDAALSHRFTRSA